MKIILGSQSKGRQQVLKDAGFEFEVMAANIDEKAIRTDNYGLLPLLIAEAKNNALAELVNDNAILITADTVVIYRGELREKATSIDQAREYLRSYEPTTPAISVSGVIVTNLVSGKRSSGVTQADTYLKKFDEDAIDRLVADGSILNYAAAYAIQLPQFQPYIDHIEGDLETVIGISSELVRRLITEVNS